MRDTRTWRTKSIDNGATKNKFCFSIKKGFFVYTTQEFNWFPIGGSRTTVDSSQIVHNQNDLLHYLLYACMLENKIRYKERVKLSSGKRFMKNGLCIELSWESLF